MEQRPLREEKELIDRPFAITSVCRGDLMGAPHYWSEASVLALSDGDMERIAQKMAESYLDFGGFWEALGVYAESCMEREGRAIVRTKSQEEEDGDENG